MIPLILIAWMMHLSFKWFVTHWIIALAIVQVCVAFGFLISRELQSMRRAEGTLEEGVKAESALNISSEGHPNGIIR